MTDVIAIDGFDGLLRGVLLARVGVDAPRGLEQRLLARLAQEDARVVAVMPQRFGFAERVAERRSAASAWFAVGAHAAVLVVLVGIASVRVMSRKDVGKTVASVEVQDTMRMSDPLYRVAAETAMRAVRRCSPFDKLPKEKYDSWKEMTMTFDPSEMLY